VSSFTTLAHVDQDSQPRVADAMSWELVSCPSGESLTSVAALMRDHSVHCVVVIDDPSDVRSLWGIVSDLDLIEAASVRRLTEQTAGATATTPAVTISPGDQLDLAASLMTRYGVAHLMVVDPIERRPVGVVSTLDLATVLAAT